MSLTEAQVEARKDALGSSDAWQVCDPAQWPALKAFILGGRQKADTPHMQRGREREAPICRAVEALRPHWTLMECETVYHPIHKFILCHPDRLILSGAHADPGILEAKCPSNDYMAHQNRDRYALQVHWQYMCSGYDWGALAIGMMRPDDSEELRILPVLREERVIDMMLDMALAFWAYYKET